MSTVAVLPRALPQVVAEQEPSKFAPQPRSVSRTSHLQHLYRVHQRSKNGAAVKHVIPFNTEGFPSWWRCELGMISRTSHDHNSFGIERN
jgi:hypothetical protein